MRQGEPASEMTEIYFDEFVRFYPRDPVIKAHYDPAREELLAAPRTYSRLFGTVLHDYFSGAGPEASYNDFMLFVRDYDAWNAAHFVTTVRSIAASAWGKDPYEALTAMHFHSLNRSMLEEWAPLIYGMPLPNRMRQRDMQIVIALHACGILRARHAQLQQHGTDYLADGSRDLRAAQSGMLTESDLAIVLLEISRSRPHLVVLPAPLQFEASAPGHNVDFLVLDTRRRTVVGIQAKTTVSDKAHQGYSRNGIVLVDGSVDLGNSRQIRRWARSSTASSVAWPGLIAAHFIASARLDAPGFRLYADRIAPVQRLAKKATHGTRNYLNTAVTHISERILPRL
ncbi:hypothetical protein GCM10027416_32700 [Okibacterium endophyticum]